MTGIGPDIESTDGRTLRRHRNQDRAVHAFLDLIREGNPDPIFDEIAERGMISTRSLYRYFPAFDDLLSAACVHVVETFTEPCRFDSDADLDERITRFVEHRLDLYERTSPITQAARTTYAQAQPVQDAMLVIGEAVREQIDTVFAPELGSVPDDAQVSTRVWLYMPFVYDSLDMANSVMDRPAIEHLLGRHVRQVFDTAV